MMTALPSSASRCSDVQDYKEKGSDMMETLLNAPTCDNRVLRIPGAIALHCTESSGEHAFIVASVHGQSDARIAAHSSYALIADMLHDKRLEIVHERIFGSLNAEAAVLRERKAALSERHIPSYNPITYIEGTPPWGEGVAGIMIHAVAPDSADDIWTIMDGNTPCGRGWRRNGSTGLVLQNICGQRVDGPTRDSRLRQVQRMLERADRILRENGASYRDVARTWFYLPDILDWYAEFNKVRSEKYGAFGIMPDPGDSGLLLPASTGIHAESAAGAAGTMDLIAMVGESGYCPPVKQLTNVEQLDAFRYGSAFSRAALIRTPHTSVIEVSGTAAIDQRGRSLYPGDIRSQIDCTLDKINALLRQEGASLDDICAATVFVKQPEYAPLFRKMVQARGLDDFPAVCVVADVCREELLFEIDAEALVNREPA